MKKAAGAMPFLLAIPLTYFYVRLVFLYYAYYDIGVNNYANAGWLTYFVMPWMFVLFNAAGFTSQWLARRRGGANQFQAMGIAALTMAGLFIASFLYTVVKHLNYPSPKDYKLFEFFGYLLGVK